MTLLVKLLRRSGVVIGRDDLAQRPWTMVQMLMEVDHATGRRRLVVRDGEAGHRTEPFMELFQVPLASMSVDQFVLRGIESVGEWFATKTFMDSPLAPPRHTTPKRPLPNSR